MLELLSSFLHIIMMSWTLWLSDVFFQYLVKSYVSIHCRELFTYKTIWETTNMPNKGSTVAFYSPLTPIFTSKNIMTLCSNSSVTEFNMSATWVQHECISDRKCVRNELWTRRIYKLNLNFLEFSLMTKPCKPEP